MNTQIACPKCRSTMTLSVNGNTLDAPLVCQNCGHAFLPHFYCPDSRSPSRHIFAANVFHFDNTGVVYALCPKHTFTAYALAADNKPRPKRTPLHSLARLLDTLVFRLALTVESLRLRFVPRRYRH